MKRSVAFAFLFAFACCFSWAQSPSGGVRCLTDELHHHLRSQYPLGVSGRNEPLADGTAKTEDFDFSYVIPVVVHVMHNDDILLNVDLNQAQSQIEVLNEDFGRFGAGTNTDAAGADVRIQFCLATVDPQGNATTGITYNRYPPTVNIDPFNEDTLLKQVVQWDPNRYLNVWVVRQIADGRITGYAYFPEEVAGTIYDGFVVDYRFFGRGVGFAVSRGRTGTHEVGHYLGLLHPWGLQEHNCEIEDDGCDDTPRISREFFSSFPNCAKPMGCDGEERMIENYMDYSDDRCMNIFTNCQAEKMRTSVALYRSELVSSENLASTGCRTTLQGVTATNTLTVYPNPTSEVLLIYADYEDDQRATVEMYDFAGRRVYFNESAGFGRGPIAVDVSRFNGGLYHLIVSRNGAYLRSTVLVAH
ncbi:MAG: M43 family zinc metalloprotease [Bacteroidota bacterium]